MHDLYTLKEKLIDELAEYGRKGLTESSLKTIDTLAHAAKNVSKVIECEGKDEYSTRRDPSRDYVRPDGSYRDAGSYRDGESYARGRGARRDAMGRYSRADMSDEIMKLMDKAPDEHTKEELRRIMDRL